MVKSLNPENTDVSQWQVDGLFYEYMTAVNPKLPAVPARLYPSEMHYSGPTRIIHFDLSEEMQCDSPATWQAGAAFVTPPHLWHGHYSESSKPAIVMAVQEAAFYEYMRTLDIEFSHAAKGVQNKS